MMLNLGGRGATVERGAWKAFGGAAVAAFLGLFLFIAQAQPPAGRAGKAPPKGGVQGKLTWFDRQGKAVSTFAEDGMYRTLTISPDGQRVAFERNDPQTDNRDIWLLDVASGKTIRFTSDPAWDAFPIWSPKGDRIIFTSNRGGVYDLYVKDASGSGNEQLLYRSSEGKGSTSWSPDGRYLLYYSIGQPTHLRLLTVAGEPDRKAVPVVDPQFSSITGRFSPDGRWIVYSSNESGTNEVSVRLFDPATGLAGNPVVVTSGGGRTPLWRGDGKELFYIGPDGMVTAVAVNAGATFHAGTPQPLFPAPRGVLFWDVAPDGKRFLMPVPDE